MCVVDALKPPEPLKDPSGIHMPPTRVPSGRTQVTVGGTRPTEWRMEQPVDFMAADENASTEAEGSDARVATREHARHTATRSRDGRGCVRDCRGCVRDCRGCVRRGGDDDRPLFGEGSVHPL